MRSRAIQAEKYLKIIENGFLELLNKPLSEITKTDLVKWVQSQTELHNQHIKGYASATIIQRHGALKCLKHLYQSQNKMALFWKIAKNK